MINGPAMTDEDRAQATRLDIMARAVFSLALLEGPGEVLWRLFDGQAVTIDVETRQLVFAKLG